MGGNPRLAEVSTRKVVKEAYKEQRNNLAKELIILVYKEANVSFV